MVRVSNPQIQPCTHTWVRYLVPGGEGRNWSKSWVSCFPPTALSPLWETLSPGTSEIILVPRSLPYICIIAANSTANRWSTLFVNWPYYVKTAVSTSFFLPSEDRLARYRCLPKLAATLFPTKVSWTSSDLRPNCCMLQSVSDLLVFGVQITLCQFIYIQMRFY